VLDKFSAMLNLIINTSREYIAKNLQELTPLSTEKVKDRIDEVKPLAEATDKFVNGRRRLKRQNQLKSKLKRTLKT